MKPTAANVLGQRSRSSHDDIQSVDEESTHVNNSSKAMNSQRNLSEPTSDSEGCAGE